jgi:hypothetical protein
MPNPFREYSSCFFSMKSCKTQWKVVSLVTPDQCQEVWNCKWLGDGFRAKALTRLPRRRFLDTLLTIRCITGLTGSRGKSTERTHFSTHFALPSPHSRHLSTNPDTTPPFLQCTSDSSSSSSSCTTFIAYQTPSSYTNFFLPICLKIQGTLFHL